MQHIKSLQFCFLRTHVGKFCFFHYTLSPPPPPPLETVQNLFGSLTDLTLTGKQCPRLLSGYQKARQEEASILASLREEGFISTSKQKTGGGVAFEIIEATPETESAGSSKFKPKVSGVCVGGRARNV